MFQVSSAGLPYYFSTDLLSIVKAWVGEMPHVPYISTETIPHGMICHVIAVSSTVYETSHISMQGHREDWGGPGQIQKVGSRKMDCVRGVCIPILQDYKPEWDPSKFHSEKTGRAPPPQGLEGEGLPLYVLLQADHLRVQVVGTAGSSGEPYASLVSASAGSLAAQP